MQDRGPAAYIAEFIGTLRAGVLHHHGRVALRDARRRQTNPHPFIDFSRDRAGARVRAVHADPDAGGGLRRALQPGGHRRADRAAPDQAARRGDLHRRPARRRGGRRAAHQAAARRFPNAEAVELRRRRRSATASTASIFPGMLAEGIGTFFLVWAIVGVAVNPRGAKDWAALRHRRDAGPRRDGARPAHRRRLQPGARLRPGAGVRRVRRRRTTSCSSTCWRRCSARWRRRSPTSTSTSRPGKKGAGGMEPVG